MTLQSSSWRPRAGTPCPQGLPITQLLYYILATSPNFLHIYMNMSIFPLRQACTIESSATRSGRAVAVVMTSAYLNLRDNVTCYLFTSVPHLKIYTVDYHSLSVGTPVGE